MIKATVEKMYSAETVPLTSSRWVVKTEGMGRVAYTYVLTQYQAEQLAVLANINASVAEKLHGCVD